MGDVVGVEQGPLVYEFLVEDRFVLSRVPAASGLRGTLVIKRQVAKGPERGMARSAGVGRGVYSFDCGQEDDDEVSCRCSADQCDHHQATNDSKPAG
jgi:hypothetical protein